METGKDTGSETQLILVYFTTKLPANNYGNFKVVSIYSHKYYLLRPQFLNSITVETVITAHIYYYYILSHKAQNPLTTNDHQEAIVFITIDR
jgi:ADP-dependent phosphofructokinase/glucokinase